MEILVGSPTAAIVIVDQTTQHAAAYKLYWRMFTKHVFR